MKKKIFSGNINIGKLIFIIGFLVIMPVFVVPFYPEDSRYLPAFAIPGVISFFLGYLINFFSKEDDEITHWRINMENSSLTVLLAWIYGFAIGALPFIIAGYLSPLHAIFEAVSGWTTTGLSVMDVTVTPKIFLFHRAFMQFCGGLGFVMVVLMFLHGKQAMNLYSAEGHADKLTPNLRKTAQIIFILYISFVIIGAVSYRLFGMNFFDALLHSMCALSTGGFSTQLNSIGEYNGIATEVITIILMFIGTTNFAVLLLLAKRKLKQVSRVSEVKFMFALIVIVIIPVTFSLIREGGMDGFEAFRHSAFNTISALSTTGYSTIAFDNLPQFALGIFVILMLIGGGMGSTAGGIKMSRVYIMLRVMMHSLRKRMSPTRQVEMPHYMKAQGKISIDTDTVSETTGFFLTYISIFVTGALVLTLAAGCSLLEAAFEFSSALGTVGLSIGITSANSNAMTLITLIPGMILGRLEIFIVLIGVYSGFKVSKKKLRNRLERRRVSYEAASGSRK